MTKLISISADRNIFEEGSAVRARQIEYGKLFDELHIIIFSKKFLGLPEKSQIASNVWVYATNSLSKLFYIKHATKIAGDIIKKNNFSSENSVVTVQDPFETGLVGLNLKKKFGLPLHVQIHTDFLAPNFAKQSFLNGLRVKVAKKLLPKADGVRVVSRRILDSLNSLNRQGSLSGLSFAPGVVPAVLPIFVDIKKIEEAPVNLDLKSKYPQFNFIILIASRLTSEKNIPFAISLFSKLLNVYSRIGLVIVGSGPEEGMLKALVRRLKLQKSVIFEPWQNDLASYYKTANLFLLTSNYEGYGLTLAEAVISHCPVVSSDVGIAPELLRGGQTSPICPVGDMECFFNQISNLIENPGVREQVIHEVYDRLDQVVIFDKKEYLEKYQKGIVETKIR